MEIYNLMINGDYHTVDAESVEEAIVKVMADEYEIEIEVLDKGIPSG